MSKTASPEPRHENSLSLANYFVEIDETTLLDAEQEHELAERVLAGDAEAREQMIRANLRLVVHLARRCMGKGLSLERDQDNRWQSCRF